MQLLTSKVLVLLSVLPYAEIVLPLFHNSTVSVHQRLVEPANATFFAVIHYEGETRLLRAFLLKLLLLKVLYTL
jgi:hypothetical protein